MCDRKSDGEYCILHKKALDNLSKGYEQWRNAANLEWNEYLLRIKDNQASGQFVIDVCIHLLDRNEKGKKAITFKTDEELHKALV